MNLEKMSVAELQDLRSRVDKALINAEDRNRKAAMIAVEEAARSHGFNSIGDLMKVAPTKSDRPSVPAKYRNPADPGQTWSGRGRQPVWIRLLVKEGRNMEDLLIDKPEAEAPEAEAPEAEAPEAEAPEAEAPEAESAPKRRSRKVEADSEAA